MNTSEKEKQIIKATIQFKRGTTAAWEANGLILAAGEPGFNLTDKKLKIGDGIHTYDELPEVNRDTIDENTLSTIIATSQTVQETINQLIAQVAPPTTYAFDVRPTENSTNLVKSGGIYASLANIIDVAQGKTNTYVFDTEKDLDDWLADDINVVTLSTGDVFLIRDVETSDFWWDKTTETKQVLKARKIDIDNYVEQNDLSQAAFSGSYNDLINKPTIPIVPTNVGAFTNDAGYLTQHQSLTNYVTQNNLTTQLATKQDSLTYDNKPTANSEKMVKSGGIFSSINEVVQVANGKTACYVFDTTADLDTWLANSNNTANLKTGDVFLIRAVDVPDWWWDGTTSTKQRLETTKVDLTDYALKSEIPTQTSQLTNNSGFLTQHQSLANVNAAKVNGYNIVVDTQAPTNASNTTITIVVPN